MPPGTVSSHRVKAMDALEQTNVLKTWVVLNPKAKAGRAEKIESELKRKFPESVVRFARTFYPGHATSIARRAVAEKAETIVAVGGDGTVREVLNGVFGSRVSIGVVPAGTANDLAVYYRLPGDIDRAGDVILRHRTRPADVIEVNGECYLTAGGVGLPSEVASIANRIKSRGRLGRFVGRFLSSELYLAVTLWLVLVKRRPHHPVVVRSNGTVVASDILSLTVNNQPFLGRNFLVAPGAVNDDGQLDVCLIQRPRGRLRTLRVVLKAVSGKHVRLPGVRFWRTDRLIIEAASPLAFLGDGEVAKKALFFHIRVFPRALDVIVPETGG
jgi:diacylglycerol kinase (ATP)